MRCLMDRFLASCGGGADAEGGGDAATFVKWIFDPRPPPPRPARGDGDLYRALSVDFLGKGFLEELCVRKAEKVYDIEPRIREAGANVICPRSGDAQLVGAAYVDVAEDEHAGRAECMLSYTWGYEVHVIVDALQAYCKRVRREPQDVRVWICALCVNQWRVKEANDRGEQVPFEEFRQTFHDKVTNIGTILALLTPWDRPLYLTRVWTIFEFYTGCTTKNVNIEFVLPEQDEKGFSEKLRCDSAVVVLSDIFKTLGNIKVQEAQATYKEDRRNVMRILMGSSLDDSKLDDLVDGRLSHGDGLLVDEACKTLNESVVSKLQQWFVHSALNRVEVELESCLTGYAQVGMLCNQLGLYGDGLECLSTGIRTAQAFYGSSGSDGNGGSSDPSCDEIMMLSDAGVLALTLLLRTKAKVLTYRAMSSQEVGNQQATDDDFEESHKLHKRCKELLEQKGLKVTTPYAELAQDMPIWYGRTGQVDDSIRCALVSKKTFEAIERTQTTMYGNLLKSLGISYHTRGQDSRRKRMASGYSAAPSAAGVASEEEDFRAALEMYRESEQIFMAIGQEKNPWYLDVQTRIGVHFADQGQPEEAIKRIRFAKHELEVLGQTKSPQYQVTTKRLDKLLADFPQLASDPPS